jgi:hypothetical protein
MSMSNVDRHGTKAKKDVNDWQLSVHNLVSVVPGTARPAETCLREFLDNGVPSKLIQGQG